LPFFYFLAIHVPDCDADAAPFMVIFVRGLRKRVRGVVDCVSPPSKHCDAVHHFTFYVTIGCAQCC